MVDPSLRPLTRRSNHFESPVLAFPERPCSCAPCFHEKPLGDYPMVNTLSSVVAGISLSPLISLIAGILILIMPRLLNFIVAIYLIIIGLVGVFNL
jgi:hypothetical protein